MRTHRFGALFLALLIALLLPRPPAQAQGGPPAQGTSADVQAWAAQTYPWVQWDLSSGAPALMRAVGREWAALAADYPAVASDYRRVQVANGTAYPGSSGGYAVSTYDAIALYLHGYEWAHPNRFLHDLEQARKRGWHPAGSCTPEGVIAHEYGHQVWWYLVRTGRWQAELAELRSHQDEAGAVSGYAKTDPREAFAEAFAQLRHGTGPLPPYTRRLRALLTQAFGVPAR